MRSMVEGGGGGGGPAGGGGGPPRAGTGRTGLRWRQSLSVRAAPSTALRAVPLPAKRGGLWAA